jgi:hypothetical protein
VALTDASSPAFVLGGLSGNDRGGDARHAATCWRLSVGGAGVGWHEHDPDLLRRVRNVSIRPGGYNANLNKLL